MTAIARTPDAQAAVPDDQPATSVPFIRVMHDPDTGRTVIALDAAATDALDSYLQGFDWMDFLNNYGGHDDPDLLAQADVIVQIKSAVGKHLRGW